MNNVILCVYITDTEGWPLAQPSYFSSLLLYKLCGMRKHLKENGEKLCYIYGVQKFPHESASLYNLGETEK